MLFDRETSVRWINNVSQSNTGKPMIGVDVDEVLCPFVSQLCKFHRHYKKSDIQSADFFSYKFSLIDKYGAANEHESREILSNFFESKYFDEMPVIENSFETLLSLKNVFNFSVITSRRNNWKPKTHKWLDKYFDDIFDQRLFGNHFNSEGKSYTKSELLRQVNGKVLIDDNIKYCMDAAKDIDLVILFGNYPWNFILDTELPPNIHRANDWNAVKQILFKNAPQKQ